MKVYLDPGHGGKDPGTSGNGLVEKDVALDVALETRRILLEDYSGVEVRMSRTTDVFVSLEDRAKDAREWGADLFVSIHCNGGEANGFETFKHSNSTASAGPQRILHNAILARMPDWVRDRGTKSADFSVLRNTYQHMYAVLTENLFLGHADSAEWLKQRSARVAVARGHAEAIAEILGAEEEDNMPSAEEIALAVWRYKNEKLTDRDAYSHLRRAARAADVAKALPALLDDEGRLSNLIRGVHEDCGGATDPEVIEQAFYDALQRVLRDGAQEGTPS